MRWYFIKFTDTQYSTTDIKQIPNFITEYGSAEKTQSLFNPSGANLAGALEVVFDIEVGTFDMMNPDSSIKIMNPPLAVFQNASAYQGMQCEIYGGFASFNGSGLPLSKPQQSGLLARGLVVISYGSYVGADMSLDIVLSAPLSSTTNNLANDDKRNKFNFIWNKDKSLEDALKETFEPNGITNIKVNLQSPIDLQDNVIAIRSNDIRSFARQFRSSTQSIMQTTDKPTYIGGLGVWQPDPNTLEVIDYRKQIKDIQIAQEDIIGQPTMAFTKGMLSVQSVHPLRADIVLANNTITLNAPSDRFTLNQGQSLFPVKPLLLSNQKLIVQKIRHVGKFRDPSHQSWCTIIESGWLMKD